MDTMTLKKLATATALTFRDDFPGQEPELSWLAEAANINQVPDELRDTYLSEVRAALKRNESAEQELAAARLHGHDAGTVSDGDGGFYRAWTPGAQEYRRLQAEREARVAKAQRALDEALGKVQPTPRYRVVVAPNPQRVGGDCARLQVGEEVELFDGEQEKLTGVGSGAACTCPARRGLAFLAVTADRLVHEERGLALVEPV